MSHVLKTYDDGSELTVTGLAVLVGVCLATTAVITAGFVAWDNWQMRRRTKKYVAVLNQTEKA